MTNPLSRVDSVGYNEPGNTMPIIKSAIKRVRQQKTRTARNLATKNTYKSLIKEFLKLTEEGKTAEATKLYPQVQKSIDMAVKKNLIPANRADRMKSNLSKKLAAKPAKKAPTKKAEKKETKKAE